jgi:hypothetical protein
MAGGKDQWPWVVTVYLEPKPEAERTSDRDLTLDALKQTIDMWTADAKGDYISGQGAYAQWLQWLHDVDAGKVGNPKAGAQGNAWCFDVLVHSRRIAGPWLRAKAELFDGEAREQLLIAADHYDALVAECLKNVKSTWDLAKGPGQFDQWTPEMRSEQIRRLEAASERDAAAVAAIAKALAAIDPSKGGE